MKLIDKIKSIKEKRILVIGDVMVDVYHFGKANRISPEAPVPILLEKDNSIIPGGASNVAVNLVSGGQNVSLLSVIGKDTYGEILIDKLQSYGINTELVFKDDNRITTVKHRYIGQNNMQMFRLDQEINSPIDEKTRDNILEIYEKNIMNYDLIIISDYNKGFLTLYNTPKFIEIAKKNNIKVLIDVKEPKYEKYKNAYLIKPNLSELADITKMNINNEDDILKASIELKKNTNCEYVLVTRGGDGMSLLENNKLLNIDCASKEVYDVTGAGDTVISYLAVGIANDFDLIDSIELSNYAAGVKVSKMGTYAVKPEDIMDYIIDSNNIIDEDKIITAEKLGDVLSNRGNKKVVFTNGCFDIFHVGHLRYLKESAKLGDILVIGVNSDNSVKRLKGNNRPIVNENERMELLSTLSFVSYAVLFDEDTPYEIIAKIKPDIITKGGDYNPNDVVGKDIVEKRGGKVVICPLIENKSTTNIIDKILEVYHE